jgi:hypothetical protein
MPVTTRRRITVQYKRSWLVLLLLLAAIVVAPAATAGPPTTGSRIILFPGVAGPLVYPANTPFFVEHGWGCGDQAAVDAHSGGCLDPQTRFTLYVDGRRMSATTVLDVAPGGIVLSKFDLTNFRFGLPAGEHVFEGQWWSDGVLSVDSIVTITFT